MSEFYLARLCDNFPDGEGFVSGNRRIFDPSWNKDVVSTEGPFDSIVGDDPEIPEAMSVKFLDIDLTSE